MPARIIVLIDDNGECEMEVVGATGKKCLGISQPLEEALGTVTDRQLKPESRQPDTAVNQQLTQRR